MDYSPYLHAGDIFKQGVVASLPSSGECAKVGPFDPLGGKRVSWYGRTQKEERRVHHQSRKEKVGSAWQAQPLA